MDAYYLDVASSGGFSGAPVFTPNKWFASGTNGYYILGLIHSHRNVAGNPAIVSPAQKTKETLNHPELVALRVQHDMERAESQRAAEKAPTLRGDSLKDDAQ